MPISTDIVTIMENKTDTQETITVFCRGCFDDYTITTAENDAIPADEWYYCSDSCAYTRYF